LRSKTISKIQPREGATNTSSVFPRRSLAREQAASAANVALPYRQAWRILDVLQEAKLTVRYIHWRDGDDFLGYFEDYPDYITQGTSEEDLQSHLLDLYRDLTSGELPYVRKADLLIIPA
jgi:hypothetical protein